jgi:hypothetical protein
MTYRGRVKDGVIVLDPPVVLPEGAVVEVATVPAGAPDTPSTPTLAQRYAAVIGIIEGLPCDLAENHDHYIHGTPRRDRQ